MTTPPRLHRRTAPAPAARRRSRRPAARRPARPRRRDEAPTRRRGADALPRRIACFFEKPSTRTRVSFAAACHRLGALPLMLRPDELQLGRGEPIADTARVLSGYCAAIVIRTFAQARLDELAAAATVPVINALTDEHHPCQALADLLTLREHFGQLAGVRARLHRRRQQRRALADGGRRAGRHGHRVGLPPGLRARPGDHRQAAGHGARARRQHRVVYDPREAVAGAHAVYTDVWVSMGDEAERGAPRASSPPTGSTPELMAPADRDAVFLHCLPAHRGEEVAAEVIDGPASRRLAAGGQPPADRAGAALRARHGRAGASR